MRKFESYKKEVLGAIMASPEAQTSLKLFSVSQQDFNARLNAMAESMALTAMLEDRAAAKGAKRVLFAATAPGMGAANLRGTTIYPATILSNVSSIVPIFAVERSGDMPSFDLQFKDVYNLATSDTILPNLGPDAPFGKSSTEKDLSSLLAAASTGDNPTYKVIYQPGIAVIPRSVKYVLTEANGTKYEIVDNGNGKLLAEPGLLADGSVNYRTGDMMIQFSGAHASATLKVFAAFDTPAEDEVEMAGVETKYFHIDTEAVIIPVKRNIVNDAADYKQGVTDPDQFYNNLIQTLYTKKLNEMTVGAIVNNYTGNTYTADLSNFNLAAGRYETFIRTFQSLLTDGESKIAAQTYKGAKVTGILAGAQISNVFQYMTEQEGWIPNTQLGYFKDLIGWYKQVPVVRWTNNESDEAKVADDEIYLTVRTPDGQLAPAGRGTFLSPTDMPEIGNFKNPTQVVDGMFSLESVRPLTSKLVTKLKITLPASQMLQLQS